MKTLLFTVAMAVAWAMIACVQTWALCMIMPKYTDVFLAVGPHVGLIGGVVAGFWAMVYGIERWGTR